MDKFDQEELAKFDIEETPWIIEWIKSHDARRDAARREELMARIGKLKGWVFTAPYGLECDSFTGEVIPSTRSEDTYFKKDEITSIIANS